MVPPIVGVIDTNIYMETFDLLPDIKVYTEVIDLISKIYVKHPINDIQAGILKLPLCSIEDSKDAGCWVNLNTLTDELLQQMRMGYFRFPLLSINGTVYDSRWNYDIRCDPHQLDFDFQFKQISHEILDPALMDEFRAFANKHNWVIK